MRILHRLLLAAALAVGACTPQPVPAAVTNTFDHVPYTTPMWSTNDPFGFTVLSNRASQADLLAQGTNQASAASGLTNLVGSTASGLTNLVGSTASGLTNLVGSTASGLTNLVGSTAFGLTNLVGSTASGLTNLVGSTASGLTNLVGSTAASLTGLVAASADAGTNYTRLVAQVTTNAITASTNGLPAAWRQDLAGPAQVATNAYVAGTNAQQRVGVIEGRVPDYEKAVVHTNRSDNPHATTAAQVSALALAGGTMGLNATIRWPKVVGTDAWGDVGIDSVLGPYMRFLRDGSGDAFWFLPEPDGNQTLYFASTDYAIAAVVAGTNAAAITATNLVATHNTNGAAHAALLGGYVGTNDPSYLASITSAVNTASAAGVVVRTNRMIYIGTNAADTATAVFRTYQLWSASNSVLNAAYRAMRTLDYGTTGVGTWTNANVTNNQYIGFLGGPAGDGLTMYKANQEFEFSPTMWKSPSDKPLNVMAEMYLRETNGVERELTPVVGTEVQGITGATLKYIYKWSFTNDIVKTATESPLIKLKVSGVTDAVTLYVSSGMLDIPTPSSQYALQSDFTALRSVALTNGMLSIGYSNNMIYFNAPAGTITGMVFNIGGSNILMKAVN